MALESEKMPPPMESLAALETWLKAYEAKNEEEVDEVGLRLLAPAPDVGMPGENVSVPRKHLVAVAPPKGGRFVRVATSFYLKGAPHFDKDAKDEESAVTWLTGDPENEGKVEDVDKVYRGYQDQPYDKVRWTFAPPVLWNEGGKLQRGWLLFVPERPRAAAPPGPREDADLPLHARARPARSPTTSRTRPRSRGRRVHPDDAPRARDEAQGGPRKDAARPGRRYLYREATGRCRSTRSRRGRSSTRR